MDHIFGFNTGSVMMSGAATVASTFFKRLLPQKEADGPRKELLFDEAFNVMRMFFEKRTTADYDSSSLHTVEELQQFGNNWVPSPFWVRVVRLTVPLATRLEAGQVLIKTLGEKEIKEVIGGREWWQRSAQKEGGITGEWISMKKDWEGLPDEDEDDEEITKKRADAIKKMKEAARKREKSTKHDLDADNRRSARAGRASAATTGADHDDAWDSELSDDEDHPASQLGPDENDTYEPEMDEMRCIYYIHGGGYFFGSINTHRYSIWRYARKIGGRAFAIDYRLCPQYPFPCALSDVLAGYLYLIRPPAGATHKPVDPAKITIAGDSAGGGLTLALLCLLRDASLPLPAGGVLISPWCDLTHSFPSILENTKTDIVPAYGWLFKPSTLWPPPPPEFQERANRSTSLTELQRLDAEKKRKKEKKSNSSLFGRPDHHRHQKGEDLAAKVNATIDDPHGGDASQAEKGAETKKEAMAEVGKVLKVEVDGEPVELSEQIQLYATNEQLVHPFVSPVWQPSLGGLPPLYIMCGDKEVLRDEIVYMAHRAANPEAYPVRQALLDANPARTEMHKQYGPTKVHLQIYDNVCHDLPLLSFTTPAKYCYRAISSFIVFVTSREGISRAPSTTGSSAPPSPPAIHAPSPPFLNPNESASPSAPSTPSEPSSGPKPRKSSKHLFKSKGSHDLEQTIYSSTKPFSRPDYVDNMVRERVALDGVVRAMEPKSEVRILQMDPEELGLIKEGPVKRYLAGKTLWDKRFKRAYENVQKRREHHLKKSVHEEYHRIKKRVDDAKAAAASHQGSGASRKSSSPVPTPDRILEEGGVPLSRVESPQDLTSHEGVQGIWELHGETPPPSSIAARKDTMEARKLARFLDTHYSRLHALHLWSDVQDSAPMVRVSPPERESSEDAETATGKA